MFQVGPKQLDKLNLSATLKRTQQHNPVSAAIPTQSLDPFSLVQLDFGSAKESSRLIYGADEGHILEVIHTTQCDLEDTSEPTKSQECSRTLGSRVNVCV